MADQKISQLPTITGANMADDDKFVLVDTSGDVTVATTRAEFFKNTPNIDVTGTAVMDGLTSSGNVLVGTTDINPGFNDTNTGSAIRSAGSIFTSVSGSTAGYFNRNTNDGELISLRKDGTTVGSIRSGGDAIQIGTTNTGLYFADNTDSIAPYDISGGSVRDDAIDLGYSGGRFKDLYLSGGVYLGGAVAANKLDDYEEGTWTAVLTGSTTGASTPVTKTGTYTKVGNLVHIEVNFAVVNTTGASGSVQIQGLPFAHDASNGSAVTLGQYTKLARTSGSIPTAYINSGASLIQGLQTNASGVNANWNITATTGVSVMLSATYTT